MTLQLKIKHIKDSSFVSLSNIKNLRITLHNRSEDIKSIQSLGWRSVLNKAGNKHIIFKVNGILEDSFADKIIRQCAFQNSATDCELYLSKSDKIVTTCIIELYERYYDSNNFDAFAVVFASSGEVEFITE